jgi:hypothetical protein
VRNHLTVEFSLRYCVVGIYKDRNRAVLRIYPLPFIRITVGCLCG